MKHGGRGSGWRQNEDFQRNRFDHLPPDEHLERSRRGGIQSGITRRRIAEARDAARACLIALAVEADAKRELAELLGEYERRSAKRARRRKRNETTENNTDN